MKVKMKVGVVVPVRNNQEMIGECIESLLDQDYPEKDYEIVIVDNNSTDNTAEIIKRYPVKYVFEGTKGKTNARNKGIKNASGDIIVFTDSDCIADRRWLSEIVREFEDKDIGGVGGKILGHEVSTRVEKYLEILYNAYNQNFSSTSPPRVITGNAAYRRDVLEEVGYFDESFETGEDYDLSWRVFWRGYSIRYAPNAIIYHRHRSSARKLFSQYFGYGKGYVRLINKHRGKLNFREERIRRMRGYYRILSSPNVASDNKEKLYFYFCIIVQNLGFSLGKMFEKVQRKK